MKNTELFEALGGIDEKFLEESENYRGKKSRAWIGALAACLAAVIALSASFPVLMKMNGHETPTVVPTSNTSVTTQATSTAAPLPTVKREYTALVYDFAD